MYEGKKKVTWKLTATILLILCQLFGYAGGGVTFTDIAAGGGAGIDYGRVPSPDIAWYADSLGVIYPPPGAVLDIPWKARGNPGVALFDYDNDGDLDIYITNGPGADNSLFANQYAETGVTTFIDMASIAGVTATCQDSSGTVSGDIDNDGDRDLLVLGMEGPNILYENNGDGTFTDISATSGICGGDSHRIGASMGDINGDGLLDIVIGKSFDHTKRYALRTIAFDLNEPNQLYLNLGNNQFADVSTTSGIRNTKGFAPEDEGKATITWAIAMVDYDQDGDIDIIQADDQAGIPEASAGGKDTGIIHFFQNDGTGHFVDRVVESGVRRIGAWMGLSFGDFNADGILDFFATNFGSYTFIILDPDRPPETRTCDWFLGQGGGVFTRPGAGALVANPFGWGTSTLDYDNDGDRDIIYHGSDVLSPLVDLTNPGALLQNDGSAHFTYDDAALAGSTEHLFRNVQGVVTGDLNGDGFVDIVTSSNFDIPQSTPTLTPNPGMFGSPFDGLGYYIRTFLPTGFPGEVTMNEDLLGFSYGTLSVELNSADNGNAGVEVRAVGGIGLTPEGKVNRDGVGALISFAPHGGSSDMVPVVAGSSYSSQDSLAANFGLGTHGCGTVEIMWPGGVKNRLEPVHAGTVVFPEIPVSYDDPSLSLPAYLHKVKDALDDYVAAGVIPVSEKGLFLSSAIRAYNESH
jgi:hypothetical protein